MAEKAQILIDIETEGAAKNLGQLEDRASALSEALKGADFGTAEYKKLSQELIKTNREVKNLELSFEALDSEQVASEVGSVAGAIGDVATSMVLLSGGNEELAEMAERIEMALGVSLALKGSIEGLSSARKLWNDAMARGNKITEVAIMLQQKMAQMSKLALGIWAAGITAIIALGVAIHKWATEMSGAEAAQDELNKAELEGAAAAAKEEVKIKSLVTTIKDVTASTVARKDALEQLNEIIPDTIGFITEETIRTGEANNVIKEYLGLVKTRAELAALEATLQEQVAERVKLQIQLQQAGNDAGTNANKIVEAGIEKSKEFENAILSQINALQQELSVTEAGTGAKQKSVTATNDEIKSMKERTSVLKENTDAVKEEIDLTERRSAAQLELDRREIESIEDKYERERALAVFNYEQSIAALDENIEEENQLIISKKQELYNTLREIDVVEFEDQILRELEKEYSILEGKKIIAEEEARIQKEKEEKIAADRERAIEQAKQGAQDLLNATEALANFQSAKELQRAKDKVARGEKLTKAEIKRLERQDKIQKAFALAQIAADTARGISAAIAAGAGLPFPANLGAIASGVAAVIAGSVQAAQVLGEAPEIPSVDVTSDAFGEAESNAQNTPQTNDFGFGSTLLNQPNKVYVVESDISTTQNKVAVVEAQASYG